MREGLASVRDGLNTVDTALATLQELTSTAASESAEASQPDFDLATEDTTDFAESVAGCDVADFAWEGPPPFDDITIERMQTEEEMRKSLDEVGFMLRVKYYPVMMDILESDTPHEIRVVRSRPWSVKAPWLGGGEAVAPLELKTAGGLIFRLYLLVMDPKGGSLSDAMAMVDELMTSIPCSTFSQVAAVYHLIWKEMLEVKSAPPPMRNLFVVGMMGLGELIAKRFGNMSRIPWPSTAQDLRSIFNDPDTDLVAVVAQTLFGPLDINEVQRRLRNKCLRGSALLGNLAMCTLSLVTDERQDYVLILDPADSTVRLVCKSLFAIAPVDGQAHQRIVVVEGRLPDTPRIRIRPSGPGDELQVWWKRNMGGWKY